MLSLLRSCRALLRNLPRDTVLKIADRVPSFAWQRVFPRNILAFYYHVVSNQRLPHIEHLFPYKTPQQFEDDLLYLRRNYSFADPRMEPPDVRPGKPAVILTFDDGLVECFTIVRPLLLKYGIPCIFFLTGSVIDNRSLLGRHMLSLCLSAFASLQGNAKTRAIEELSELFPGANIATEFPKLASNRFWSDSDQLVRWCTILNVNAEEYLREHRPYLTTDQAVQLQKDGFVIGSHTVTHPKLADVPEDQFEAEIVEGTHYVQQLTGQSRIPFAFPYSSWDVDPFTFRSVLDKYPDIGPCFDAHGIYQGEICAQSRIWADPPESLPHAIHKAYMTEFSRII